MKYSIKDYQWYQCYPVVNIQLIYTTQFLKPHYNTKQWNNCCRILLEDNNFDIYYAIFEKVYRQKQKLNINGYFVNRKDRNKPQLLSLILAGNIHSCCNQKMYSSGLSISCHILRLTMCNVSVREEILVCNNVWTSIKRCLQLLPYKIWGYGRIYI